MPPRKTPTFAVVVKIENDARLARMIVKLGSQRRSGKVADKIGRVERHIPGMQAGKRGKAWKRASDPRGAPINRPPPHNILLCVAPLVRANAVAHGLDGGAKRSGAGAGHALLPNLNGEAGARRESGTGTSACRASTNTGALPYNAAVGEL